MTPTGCNTETSPHEGNKTATMAALVSSENGVGQKAARFLGLILIAILGYSFWLNESWLTLCAGLAIFLFGMQCLEEGLRNLAGSALERMLARGTSTSWKSLLVGLVGATVMQSSTLVSLMTIAFITTGLISLAAAYPSSSAQTWARQPAYGCCRWPDKISACRRWRCP